MRVRIIKGSKQSGGCITEWKNFNSTLEYFLLLSIDGKGKNIYNRDVSDLRYMISCMEQ